MTDEEQFASEAVEFLRRLFTRLSEPQPERQIGAEEEERTRRRDPDRVPGSKHFASMLAYGDFRLADGPNIRCQAIPGISGVATLPEVNLTADKQPEVKLQRLLTHFHFDEPRVAIEQHYGRESDGVLTGAGEDSLLPGRASFSQYLILTLGDRPLANPKPLVMTAERVEEWPPIGATFVSEEPTPFVDIENLENPDVDPVAHLMACKSTIVTDLGPSLPSDHQRSFVS